jgi:hypothetical protein
VLIIDTTTTVASTVRTMRLRIDVPVNLLSFCRMQAVLFLHSTA